MRTSPVPSQRKRRRGSPATKTSKGAATNGRWQRRFPPVPCRRKFRQGAEVKNEWPGAWFPLSGINCQYENVRRC